MDDGLRFITEPESWYADTEGECLAVTWSLNNTHMFVLGCKELIVVMDHKPLLGILNERNINSITNSRLQSLKEKTLQQQYTVQYCPGKWNCGADSVSQDPCKNHVSFLDLTHTDLPTDDSIASYAIEENTSYTLSIKINILNKYTSPSKLSPEKPNGSIKLEQIKDASCYDTQYQELINQIKQGFPKNRNDTDPLLSIMESAVQERDRVVLILSLDIH